MTNDLLVSIIYVMDGTASTAFWLTDSGAGRTDRTSALPVIVSTTVIVLDRQPDNIILLVCANFVRILRWQQINPSSTWLEYKILACKPGQKLLAEPDNWISARGTARCFF